MIAQHPDILIHIYTVHRMTLVKVLVYKGHTLYPLNAFFDNRRCLIIL